MIVAFSSPGSDIICITPCLQLLVLIPSRNLACATRIHSFTRSMCGKTTGMVVSSCISTVSTTRKGKLDAALGHAVRMQVLVANLGSGQ